MDSFAPREGEGYEAWLHRVGTAAQIEVNLNTGEVTVKAHHMRPLPRTVAIMSDVRWTHLQPRCDPTFICLAAPP